MKRSSALFLILPLVLFIITNCTGIQNLPSELPEQATAIASTVEAGVESVQNILTPPAAITATPEGVIDLTNVCIPPLDMTTRLTELTLEDGRKLVVTNGWLTVFKADGTMETTLLVPAERDTPLVDLNISVETFRCEDTNVVYYRQE